MIRLHVFCPQLTRFARPEALAHRCQAFSASPLSRRWRIFQLPATSDGYMGCLRLIIPLQLDDRV
jgi:hypothetical protein